MAVRKGAATGDLAAQLRSVATKAIQAEKEMAREAQRAFENRCTKAREEATVEGQKLFEVCMEAARKAAAQQYTDTRVRYAGMCCRTSGAEERILCEGLYLPAIQVAVRLLNEGGLNARYELVFDREASHSDENHPHTDITYVIHVMWGKS